MKKLIAALILSTAVLFAQSDCGDCGQCVVVFHVCTGGQTCCGLTNTLLCHYVVSSEFCGEWQYFTCGGQPFPQCQGGLAAEKGTISLIPILTRLLPDSLRILHERAEHVSGLHGFLGSKTNACPMKGKYETSIRRAISLRRS